VQQFNSALDLPKSHRQRIFDAVHATIKIAFPESNPEQSCHLFALLGAVLLQGAYGFAAARIQTGAALARLHGDELKVFGHPPGPGEVEPTADARFCHSWIVCPSKDGDRASTAIIDLNLGLMPERFKREGRYYKGNRYILWHSLPQLEAMSMGTPGDFRFYQDMDLQDRLISPLIETPRLGQAVEFLRHWYVPPNEGYMGEQPELVSLKLHARM